MTVKKKVKKLPKPNSWQAIEHELRMQDAWGEQVVDGDSFLVFGEFTERTIGALTDRYPFNVRPISGVLFFKNNPQLKERLRFGGNDEGIRGYALWDKKRVHPPNKLPFLEKSALNWDYRFWCIEKDDRYICSCSMNDATKYFYRDRVI